MVARNYARRLAERGYNQRVLLQHNSTQLTMKTIKTFNNASVVSVVDGIITLRVNDNEIHSFSDASIVSIVNGAVTIAVENVFTDDMLEPGMVVEYRDGRKRLVLKIGGQLMFCANDSWRIASMVDKDFPELDVVKVFQPKDRRVINELLNNPDNLIWSE
jgi:hypothetical protein